MVSNHKRNVAGMHEAPRCEAMTRDGEPCLSPAVRGKKRCHVHGGKVKAKKRGTSFRSAYSLAELELSRALRKQMSAIDRLIHKIERGDEIPDLVSHLVEVRQALDNLTGHQIPYVAKAKRALPKLIMTPDGWVDRDAEPSSRPEVIRDRAHGAMLGLAVGNALGVTIDGQERDSYRPITSMLGGGRFDLPPGQWVESTGLALVLMDSLTYRRSFDEADFMERLLTWHDEGVLPWSEVLIPMEDMTREAVQIYRDTGDPVAGLHIHDRAGNGALVRSAAVAIRYWNDDKALRDTAKRQGLVTHGAQQSVDACVKFAQMLANTLGRHDRHSPYNAPVVPGEPDSTDYVMNPWKEKSREQIETTAYVEHSLEAARWCVWKTRNFEDAVKRAVNLAGASASIGALTGQLAGAIYGAHAIPSEWLESLALRDGIIDLTDMLFDQSLAEKPDK